MNKNEKHTSTKYWYHCPKCGKRVGQIDPKYNPWCAHGNTQYDAHKMTMMELEREQ